MKKQPINWDGLTQKLKDEPLTLLHDKLDFIVRACKKHNVKSLLEVGSFAGASAYILGTRLPNTTIKSIDINEFDEFFQDKSNNHILKLLKDYYPGLRPQHLVRIQDFYNSQLPNITINRERLKSLDISEYDAIIVDGDHTDKGLRSDLKYILKNNTKCIIFVDDTDFNHLKKTTELICTRERGFRIKYVYRKNSLAIITRIPK